MLYSILFIPSTEKITVQWSHTVLIQMATLSYVPLPCLSLFILYFVVNHFSTNALNTLLVPGNQAALHVAPGQIKPGNLPKKEELTVLDSGSWLRRRRDCKSHV